MFVYLYIYLNKTLFSPSQSRDSLVSSRQGIFYSILLTMTSFDIPISALPDSFRLSDVLKLSAVVSGSRRAHRLYIFSRTDFIMSFPCDCVCFLSDNEIKAMFMLLAVVSYLCICPFLIPYYICLYHLFLLLLLFSLYPSSLSSAFPSSVIL